MRRIGWCDRRVSLNVKYTARQAAKAAKAVKTGPAICATSIAVEVFPELIAEGFRPTRWNRFALLPGVGPTAAQGQGVYFDSLTVVFGWLLPYFLVTYRPETADRYLPDDDEPRRARPLLFAAMCFDSFPGLGSAPARPTFGRARK